MAGKSCLWAMHLAKRAGVKFVLHPEKGNLQALVSGQTGRVTGIETCDGKTHEANLVVVSCQYLFRYSIYYETTDGSRWRVDSLDPSRIIVAS